MEAPLSEAVSTPRGRRSSQTGEGMRRISIVAGVLLDSAVVAGVLASAPTSGVVFADAGGAVFRMDLADISPGPFTESDLRYRWRLSSPYVQLGDRSEVASVDGRKVLKVGYPQGGVGPKQTGALFVISVPESDEYYLSYRMKLDEGFDFAKGGKLPGLSSSGCKYTGGRIPTAGDGWSARLQWRPNGALAVYVYHVGMKGPWGDTLHLANVRLAKGTWHTLVERVRLNTDGRADGVLQVWVDGKLALDRSDFLFRSSGKGRIGSLCFSSFHGGHSEDYAPRTDGHAFFDDVAVSVSRPQPRGRQPLHGR